MSPEQDHRFEDDQRQRTHAMLGSVVDAIQEEDYEFASDTALAQTLISPVDLVEYVHIKGKNEEDPVAQRRLKDGVVSIVASLHEREQAEASSGEERSLTEDDIARIHKIMEELELQAMEENETLADEPNTNGIDNDQHIEEPDYDWDRDVFSPDLSGYSEEEIEKAEKSIVFKTATEQARDEFQLPATRIRQAREIIEESDGKYKELQLLMLDEIISETAEQTAQDEFRLPATRVRQARELIEAYASDCDSENKLVTARMLSSLDKYTARTAERTAHDEFQLPATRVREARELIEAYASSTERAQAMLDEFGL